MEESITPTISAKKKIDTVKKRDKSGRVLTAVDGDWPSVVGNLCNARNSWGRLSRILSREGVDPKVLGHFFKAVSQAVLLFGAATWVITPRTERSLDRFQHRFV